MSNNMWWAILSPLAIILVALITGIVALATWKGKVDNHMITVMKYIDEMREDIRTLFRQLGPTLTHVESPIALTEQGKTISEQVKAKEWAKSIAPVLRERAVDLSKEFEIYELCETYVTHEFEPDEELDVRIREVAYEHGIDKTKVLVVFPIELRDALLEIIELD